MSSSQVKFRTACEACHKRKIRCDVPQDGGSCQNCSASGLTCLFAPRQKAGRPRLVDSLQKGTSQPRRPSSRSPSQSETTSCSGSCSSPTSNSPLSSHSSKPLASWNWRESHFFKEMHGFGTSRGEPSSTPGTTSDPDQSLASPHLPPGIDSDSMIIPTYSGNMPQAQMGSMFDFDFILKSCRDLEENCRLLRETPHSAINLHNVVLGAESSCALAMQASFYLSKTDGASTSLLVAAIYKVFEICEILLTATPTPTTPDQSMDTLVLVKKVDLLLLQANVAATRMSQIEATKKASQLHFWAESLIQQNAPICSW